MERELLISVGEYIFGPDWRRPMAKALGPYHPAGARETIDPRLPARWATGEREIPGWVQGALWRVIGDHREHIILEHARALHKAGLLKSKLEA